MLRKLITTICSVLFVFITYSQVVLNGVIDNIEELVKKNTVYVPMDDGTQLATDIFVPVFQDSVTTDVTIGGSTYTLTVIPRNTQFIIYDTVNISEQNYKLPIVYTRTPYDKNSDDIGWQLFPFMGYAYAMQDMRGRYSSEGVYFPMYSDGWAKTNYLPLVEIPMDITAQSDANNSLKHHDGSQSIFYLADSLYRIDDVNSDGIVDTLLYCNGNIGMFGASALGNSQYQALSDIPFTGNNPLKCILPVVAANEHYNSTLFHNGVYRHSLTNGWMKGQLLSGVDNSLNAIDAADITNNIHSPSDYNYLDNMELANDLIDWFVATNLGFTPACQHPSSKYRTILDASKAPVNYQGYSDGNGTTTRYKNLNVPSYNLTGWWDIFINGQIETFNKIKHENPGVTNKIVIGPWTHQTIGGTDVGDETYPDNVKDVLSIDLDIDPTTILSDSTAVNKIYRSELLKWYRSNLGGEPFFIIPKSSNWQSVGTSQVRIPASNYIIPYYKFLNYLGGVSGLNNIPVEINNGAGSSTINLNFPAINPPLFPLTTPLTAVDVNYFNQVSDVRMYITGPSNDAQNTNVGNYWLSNDSIPFKRGIQNEVFYLHQNQTLNNQPPINNEGVLSYIADPNNPVATVGGNNMIPTIPNGTKKSQGSMDMTNALYDYLTMNRSDVLQFISDPISDTLSFVGFPKAKIYAKGKTSTYATSKTDYDIMVRVLDVYPDGREMFITEGVVNAKAREYAKSIAQGDTNDNLILSNINNDEYYYFEFDLLPLGHTFGKNHQIKLLLSSSNFPKYQSNPHIPHEDGDFFRWEPGSTQTYNYYGQTLAAQNAEITYDFNPNFPSLISFPRLDTTFFTAHNKVVETLPNFDIYPNPTTDKITVVWNKSFKGDILIYDYWGKCVKTITTDNNKLMTKIDLNGLSNGFYIVRIPELNCSKKLIKN